MRVECPYCKQASELVNGDAKLGCGVSAQRSVTASRISLALAVVAFVMALVTFVVVVVRERPDPWASHPNIEVRDGKLYRCTDWRPFPFGMGGSDKECLPAESEP